jgi:hypothetical protein
MSKYEPWVLAGLKLEEYQDDRDINEMTWIEAEKALEAYEELEERIDEVADGIAEVMQEALENSVQWQLDRVLINHEEDPHNIVETKLLTAALQKLMECYTPAT